MSNQRSCILFIALVIILFYLYYESIQKKELNETREKLFMENSSPDRMWKEESKVLFRRQLLSYSSENAEVPAEDIWGNSTNSVKLKTLNTFSDQVHGNKNLKRVKRNARHRKGIYKWKFNVSVSKLDNEFTKPTDDLKNSFEEKNIEEESLNVEIYVDGKTKQFKNLEHSWHAVKDSLRNFYRVPNEPRGKDVLLNSREFSTQTSQIDLEESVMKESVPSTSSEDSFSLAVQKSSEKSVQEDSKQINESSRGREAKFLFLDFGGGGNKENPPILPEIGGNMVTKSTTESMHDLSFVNSTEKFDIKIEEGGVFSSTLLPEHENLDVLLPEPNLSLTTKSEPKLEPKIEIATQSPNPTFSDVLEEIGPSIESQTVAENRKSDTTKVDAVQINLPKDIIDLSPDSIQMFCLNFVQSLRKSPRFEDDIGSGRLDKDNNMEILKVTDEGSGHLDVESEIESLMVTTQTVTTIKTAQQQLGLLQRLWNRIPNFRNRNQRKVVDEDLDISGFPMDFSVQDCKDLFTDQIKSEFDPLQTTLEETTLTEAKNTPLLFSPDSLIREIENSSKNNLDFIRKTDALKIDEITSRVTPDLFVKFQDKPTTESLSHIFQTVPLFHDQILTPDESNMASIVPVKQTESTDNLNKITLAEESSLKIEDSVEQSKVSKSLIISLNETLTDLNTESLIPLNMQSQTTISSDTSEDLAIIPSEHIIEEDKRFFSDLNNDDILELGSSDEPIVSNNVATINENDQKTSISERRFIPNFFNAGSGARELPESFTSTDIYMDNNEFILSETNAQSVSDNIFLEDENSFKKTNVDFMQTPRSDSGRRFIPNFFSGGSGARELPELYTTTLSNRIFMEELSEEKVSINDLIDSSNEFSSLKPFDIGSGERKLDVIEVTPKTEDLNINSRSDNVSLSELVALSSATDGLINEKIVTTILQKVKTDPPDHREAFMDEIGSGEFLAKNLNSDQNVIFGGSGDGREISEILFNDTVFTSDQLCTNCTDIIGFPDDCDVCDYFEEMETPDSNVTNETAFILSPTNVSQSAICNDCEGFNNDKFPSASEISLTTQKPGINSNVSIKITEYQADDTLSLTAEEPPTESKHPRKEAVVTSKESSHDSEAASSTFSNSDRNDPRYFALLLGSEEDTHSKDQVYFEPEPENSVQPKSTQPSRRARLNDVLPSDVSDFSSKPETAVDISSHSTRNESTFGGLIGSEQDTFNDDQMHFKPEPKIPSKLLTSRRGARFDSLPGEPSFTSKSETTVSDVQMSLRPTQSLNSFQSRRGARGHDLFDLEKLDAAITETVSKEETESTFEEAPSTLAETKIEGTLNETLIVEDREHGITKSTDPLESLERSSPEISRTTSESVTSLLSGHSSVTHSILSTSSTEKIQTIEVNLNPELTLPSLKFCHSASECNVSLNERCMPNNDTLLCNCGRAFRRNLETKRCEATITLQTSITLPEERFHEDLRNRNTELYQQKKRDYIKIMWFLLKNDPKLFYTVAEIDITSFEEGSLIVNYTMKLLDNGNETASDLLQHLQEDLNKIINDQELLKNASLEFKNASVSINVINPCLSSETNYCHKNALCIPTEERGFKCQCKADYLDNSRDKRYPGENCTEICDSNYCGNHGFCYVKDDGEKQCRCDGWYLGGRCDIYGLVVIAGFAFVSFLVVACVVLFVFYCKKSRHHQLCNRNMTNFQPGQDDQSDHPTTRVVDEIAPHIRMSKYLAISTPNYEAPNPTIQITSPSFTGSSIDYDSTFDRSPYNSESSKNENGTPKV